MVTYGRRLVALSTALVLVVSAALVAPDTALASDPTDPPATPETTEPGSEINVGSVRSSRITAGYPASGPDLPDPLTFGVVTLQYRGDGVSRIKFTNDYPTQGTVHCSTPDSFMTFHTGVGMVLFQLDPGWQVIGHGGSKAITMTEHVVHPMFGNTSVWLTPGARTSFSTTTWDPGSASLGQGDHLWIDIVHDEGHQVSLHPSGIPVGIRWSTQHLFHPYQSTNPVHHQTEGTCGPLFFSYRVGIIWTPTAAPATFTADPMPGQPGAFWFIEDHTGGTRQWDFGDGTTSAEMNPIHQYELPGSYTVTLCKPDTPCSSQVVEVAAPELNGGMVLRHDDESNESLVFDLDEEFTVVAIVEAGEGVGDLTLSFTSALDELMESNPSIEVLEGPSPALPDEEFAAAPGERLRWEWRVAARQGGNFNLGTTVAGVDAIGRAVGPVPVSASGMIGGLQVEVIVPEDPVQLEESSDGDVGVDGLPLDAGFEPETVEVIVRVTVPEGSPDVTDLRPRVVSQADGYLDIDLVASVGGGWAEVLHQPVPMPTTVVSGPDPGSYDGPVAAGESRDFVFEVEVTKPGAFRLRAQAEGIPEGGSAIFGQGSDVLVVKGDPILLVQLAASAQHGSPDPRVVEGDWLRVTGVVENLSLTETIRLYPVHVASEGQGMVMGPVAIDDDLPWPGEIGVFGPELAPGQRELFHLEVSTLFLEGVDSTLLVGRDSILLSTHIGGIVIDAEGHERDLTEDEVLYQVGNGRHVTDGRTLLRAGVDPKFEELPTYDFVTWSLGVVGFSAERLLQNTGEFFVQLPELLVALPSLAWQAGSWLGSLTLNEAQAYMATVKYAWAWYDYHMALYLDMSGETEAAILAEVAADVDAKWGRHFESREQVIGFVNGVIQIVFVAMIDWGNRAHEAADHGFTEELAEIFAEPIAGTAGFILEEIAFAAIFSWFSKARRSAQAAEDVTSAAARHADEGAAAVANATDDVWRAGNNPKVSEAPMSMRTLNASAPVSPLQAVRGWAIDVLSDANLRRLTSKVEGLPIIVAIRSRADETIAWMATHLGVTLKPVAIKPKNVDWRDTAYLGYRDGVGYGVGDRGAVALAEPLPRDQVISRLNASNADDFTRSTVLDRHSQRWKEWYGVGCAPGTNPCPTPSDISGSSVSGLKNRANVIEVDPSTGLATRKGTIDVHTRGSVPEPGANWDTSWAASRPEPRRFEMRQVADPEGLGREYWEVWLQHADGSMRRVAGDIDVVMVTDTSGRVLRGSSAENVAQQLSHAIDAQHPWSATLSNPALRDQFLAAHRWHPDPTQRGEPLLLYVNGEARVGWFDASRKIDPNNPLDSVVWLKGGAVDVDGVVRVQRDLRGTLDAPFDVPVPAAHTPGTSTVRKALLDADIGDAGNRAATCTIPVGAGGAIFRLGDSDRLEKRQHDGQYTPVDVDEECADGSIVVLPDTATLEAVAAGDLILPIIDELMDYDWRSLFSIGSCVLIAHGTATEEEACITGHGSLVLDRPLRFDHPALTMVVLVSSPDGDGGGGTPGGQPPADPPGSPDPVAGPQESPPVLDPEEPVRVLDPEEPADAPDPEEPADAPDPEEPADAPDPEEPTEAPDGDDGDAGGTPDPTQEPDAPDAADTDEPSDADPESTESRDPVDVEAIGDVPASGGLPWMAILAAILAGLAAGVLALRHRSRTGSQEPG